MAVAYGRTIGGAVGATNPMPGAIPAVRPQRRLERVGDDLDRIESALTDMNGALMALIERLGPMAGEDAGKINASLAPNVWLDRIDCAIGGINNQISAIRAKIDHLETIA